MRIIARLNVGGPAWQVSVLTRGLEAHGISSMLVTGSVADGEADFVALRDPSLPHLKVDGLGRSVRFGGDLRALLALIRLMRQHRPDIVHTHTAKAGVLGRLAATVTRVPIRVHTFHGHLLNGYFSPTVTALVRVTERVLARTTHSIVAVGEQVGRDLVDARIATPERIRVIAPGVARLESVDRQAARVALGLRNADEVVLYVGRLTAIKRLDRLISAMEAVVETRPDAVLVIAGEGDLRHELEQAASGLGERVRFLGWRSDLAVLYGAADLVALSSDNEGMPVSLIEASMAGVPCVTTDVGSADEVVLDGVTGYVVEPSPRALADAIISLLVDGSIRANFGASATVHATERYGAERLVGDHVALYRELTNTQM